jgi:tRNA(fMet)-specific endonuclease VapC
MSTYVLDTGLLLGYIRGADYAAYAEKRFAFTAPPNISLVSTVTVGEIYSLSLQFGWGENKRRRLEELLIKLPRVDIRDNQVLQKYAEIDAYSQGKYYIKNKQQIISPRNMGKNDIWIAATTSVLKATLLTTDHDFDHLKGVFLDVEYIDQKSKASDVGN